MALKLKMKVAAVSKESPHMPGMGFTRGPFAELNPFVFLSLIPAEERKFNPPNSPERIIERPTEKVRIKTGSEVERDAEIIRPMVHWNENMLQPVPVIVTLSNEEFEEMRKPTLGDKLVLTIEKEI
jgi:hypothetical protein